MIQYGDNYLLFPMHSFLKRSISSVLLPIFLVSSASLTSWISLIPQANAAPLAACSLDVAPNLSTNVGEPFSYTITLDNTGPDTGYAPYVETVLPQNTTYTGATFGIGGDPLTPEATTPVVVTNNDGGSPTTGLVTNPITGATTLLPVGSTYVVLDLPLGSFVADQTAVTVTVNATLAGGLPNGVLLTQNLQGRCGFALGADPLDNPTTDPVIQSAFATATVTPTVLKARKSMVTVHGEGETATGPDFPVTYTVGADIANTAAVTGITVTETLPDTLQMVEFTSITNPGPSFVLTFTPPAGAPQVTSTLPFTPTGPFGPGGTISLAIPNATGGMSTQDIALEYRAFVPDKDGANADVVPHTTGDSTIVSNTVSASGTYNAIVINDTLAVPIDLAARSLATQKGVELINDIGGAGYSHGDTVRYTINFQVSDYFSFEKVVLEDLLGDGATYVPNSARLSVTEEGNTNGSLPFTEATVAEGDVITTTPPPSHDFSVCGSCTLAITEDILNDDDAVSRPDDGQSLLTFDVSSVIGAVPGEDNRLVGGIVGTGSAGSPTRGTITYEATINDSFIDTQTNDFSIDSNDSVDNDVRISGQLIEGGLPLNEYPTDTSSASFNVPPPTFVKELIGITPYGGTLDVEPFSTPTPLKIGSGDQVTYRFLINIPSGNLERLVVTDFLPIPFYDSSEISTTFDTTVYTPADGVAASIPAAGSIAYGSNTAGIIPLPTPTLTTNPADNTFTVAYTNMSVFEKTPSSPTTLELFFTVTAQPKPMADNLKIVNMTTFQTDASNANAVVSSSTVAQNITKFPMMRISKGVVSSNNTNDIYTPATVGPVPFDVPGAPVPFSGTPFSTTDLAANPINSNVTSIDAGDKATFAVVLENTGSANAYEVQLEDALPSGFTAPTSIADLNLHVYDASGVDRAADTEGGLFGFIPAGGNTSGGDTVLRLSPGEALLGHTAEALTLDGLANEGKNILIVTYDLKIADTAIPRETLTNTASLTKYTSLPAGVNFVDPLDAPMDTATVRVQQVTLAKSSEDAPAGNMTFTSTGSATEGEIVRFRVHVTLPEGTFPAATIADLIPSGLRYYKPSGVTTDTTASCTPTPFNGTLPTVSVTSPTGVVGLGTNGEDLAISLGSTSVPSDNDDTNNTFCLVYDVAVHNGITAPVNLTNSVSLTIGAETYGPATTTVQGVEPNLQVTKNATPTSGDAGNIITYSIVVRHRVSAPLSSADAVDVSLSDVVPGKLLVDLLDPAMNFATDGLDNDDDGLLDALDPDEVAGTFFNAGTSTFTWDTVTTNHALFTQLPIASTITLRYKAKILDTVTPTEVINNTANLSWGSITGAPTSGIEKAGTANSTRAINVVNVSTGKATNSTTEASTGTARVTAGLPDLTIGEQATFRITANIPESTLTNFVVTDTLPAGLRADSAVVVSDDTSSPAPVIVIDDSNADLVPDRARFTFASIAPPVLPDIATVNRTITFDVTATVLSIPANSNGQTKTNTVTSTWTGQVGGAQTATTSFDIVEPVLAINKSFSMASGDAGDSTVMTLNVAHTGASNADAFDLSITDTMPAGMTIDTAFGTDGIDNDNDGSTDEADEITLGSNAATSTALTLNATTTGNPLFSAYPRVSSALIYRARVNILTTVFPGEVITNTATVASSSLPGTPIDERTYSVNTNATYTVNNASISKNVLSSSLPETTAAQLNPALTDLSIGEEVTYRIQVPMPEVMATNVRIRDSLPLELVPVSGDLISDDGVLHSFTAATFSDLLGGDGRNETIDFNLGNISNPPDGDSEILVFEVVARVANLPATSAITNRVNTATFTFDEQIGGPLSATAAVDIVTPDIDISKTASTLSGDAGDTITYTIVVTNTGSAPIYGLVVSDTPPATFNIVAAFDTDGVDNDGDTLIDEVDEASLSLVQGANLVWSNANGVTALNTVLPGVSYTLRYKAVIGTSVVPLSTHNNTVTTTGNSIPGGGANSRTVTDNDSETITITDTTGINKTLRDAVTKKVIGDVVPYRVQVAIQEGTTEDVEVRDTLPAGLIFVPGSVQVTTSNGADVSWTGIATTPSVAPASATHNATGTQQLVFPLGTVTNSNIDNGTQETITIEYDAVVANIAANTQGTTRQNTASLFYQSVLTKGPSLAPAITVIEPVVNVDLQNSYTSGDTVPYTLELANAGSDAVGILHDVVATITLPADITLAATPVMMNGPAGMTITTISAQVFEIRFPTVDTTYGTSNPILISFNGAITTSIAPGVAKNATVTMTGTSQPGTPGLLIATQALSSERTGTVLDAGGAANDYTASDNSSITITRPHLQTSSKEIIDANGGDLHILDTVTYRIHVRNTGNMAATGISVLDDLPDRIDNLVVASIPGGATSLLTPAPAGFYQSGTLSVSSISVGIGGTETIEYTGQVRTLTPNNTPVLNKAVISPANEGGIGKEVNTSSIVKSPVLELTKTASIAQNGNVPSGGTYEYIVEAKNTGDAPATNVVMSDPLPSGVIYNANSMKENEVAKTDAQDADSMDAGLTTVGAITVVTPTLAPGDTLTWKWQMIASTPTTVVPVLNTAYLTSDEGFTAEDDHTVVIQPASTTVTGSGGGSYQSVYSAPPVDPVVTPIPTPVVSTIETNECVNTAPVEAVNTSYCLKLNPERLLQFSDVDTASPFAPYIMTLKNTEIIKTGDYIASGTGNHSTGKQESKFQQGDWKYEPSRAMTRLELVKVALIANCIPIDETVLSRSHTVTFKDLPTSVPKSDEARNFAARVFYTALEKGIITGDSNTNARPFDLATPEEAVAIMLRSADALQAGTDKKADWAQIYMDFALKHNLLSSSDLKASGKTMKRDLMAKILVQSMGFNPDPSVHGYIERVDLKNQKFVDTSASMAAELNNLEATDNQCVQKFESCLLHDDSRKLTFTDVDPDSWAFPYIDILRTTKIIDKGDYIASGDGNQSTGRQQSKFAQGTWEFEPDRYATRLEFLKVVLVSNCISVEDEIPVPGNNFSFKDLPTSISKTDETKHFAARVMYTGYKYGLITGNKESEARPFDTITRAEALAMLQRARGDKTSLQSNREVKLNDISPNSWFKPIVGYFVDKGLVGELGAQLFRPDRPIKRMEMAKLMYDFMILNPKKDIRNYGLSIVNSYKLENTIRRVGEKLSAPEQPTSEPKPSDVPRTENPVLNSPATNTNSNKEVRVEETTKPAGEGSQEETQSTNIGSGSILGG